jgi:hypothetical protein
MAAAAAVPVPVPAPARAPVSPEAAAADAGINPNQMGSLFDTYNPQGALNGTFAPAYIAGYAPSAKAVKDWQALNRGVTQDIVNQTRMPNLWSNPQNTLGGNGVYGGPIQANQSYGDSRGMVDPNALRAMSQGGPYDIDARRSAIAQRIAQNNALMAAAGQAPAVQPIPLMTDQTNQTFPDQTGGA